MTTQDISATRSLPESPSLEYEHNQAKALKRSFAAGETDAVRRVSSVLEPGETITLREAQLVIAREYGHAGWEQLRNEIASRTNDLIVLTKHARSLIENNDTDALASLVKQHPLLLTWRDPVYDEVLLNATTSYANFPGADAEEDYNRLECAELLIDAGATVDPSVVQRIVDTGAHKMIAMFQNKGVLPHDLRCTVALGGSIDRCFDGGVLTDDARPDSDYVDIGWPNPVDDTQIVSDGFLYACRLNHESIARDLLAQCLSHQPALKTRIEQWQTIDDYMTFMLTNTPEGARMGSELNPSEDLIWTRTVELRLNLALAEADTETVISLLDAEPILAKEFHLLVRMLEIAAFSEGTESIIEAIVNHILSNNMNDGHDVSSPIVSYAMEYGYASAYVPHLKQIWPMPTGLPAAAAMGHLADVESWFDDTGHPQLGDLSQHNPFPEHHPEVTEQDVLDRAFAWAVQNTEYDVADYMLQHGANINTRWSTHEPASVLHECAISGRLEQAKYLVERGIDLTITDHRFEATAEGWARFNGQDEVADYLEAAASAQGD